MIAVKPGLLCMICKGEEAVTRLQPYNNISWLVLACAVCAAKASDIHAQNTREGQRKARVSGKRIGRPTIDIAVAERAKALRAQGFPYGEISNVLGISVGSAFKACQ